MWTWILDANSKCEKLNAIFEILMVNAKAEWECKKVEFSGATPCIAVPLSQLVTYALFTCTLARAWIYSTWMYSQLALLRVAHWQGLEPTLYLVLLNLHTDTSLHNACTLARAWICFYSLLEQHKSHTAWIYSLLVSAYCKPCLAKDMLSACWQCHFVTYALQVATLDCKFMDTIQSCFVDSVRVLFDCGDGVTFFRPLSCNFQCKEYLLKVSPCDLCLALWESTNSRAFVDSADGLEFKL